VHRLKVAYFTHGVGLKPRSPCIETFYQYRRYGQYESDFQNEYGKVTGPVSPREAGGFWARFFELNSYIQPEDVGNTDIATLQKTVACVQNIFGGAPFVNKNVKHLLRIAALAQIFPDSVFLIVERQISDVALSLLRARYKNSNNPEDWFSVRPTNYDALRKLSILEQVANQCKSLAEKMEKDLSELPGPRVMRIRYEDFCEHPEALIERVSAAINAAKTEKCGRSDFAVSHNSPASEEEKNLLERLAVYL